MGRYYSFASGPFTKNCDFGLNGVYYRITSSNTVAVTPQKETYYRFTDDEVSYVGRRTFECGYSGKVIIPATVLYNGTNYTVSAIDQYSFVNGTWDIDDDDTFTSEVTSVTVPGTVKRLQSFTFSHCSKLTQVVLEDGVETLEDLTFYDCQMLTSIDLPSSIKYLNYSYQSAERYGIILNCPNLQFIKVHWTTPLAISAYVFNGIDISEICLCIPTNSKSAYENATVWKNFKEIIETITFADAKVKALCVANWDTNGDGELSEAEAAAVKTLGSVFKSSRNVKTFNELKYFTGLTNINDNAFSYSSLMEITLPASVTEIKWSAFEGAYISTIVLPDGLKVIESGAFEYCDNLTAFNFGDNITSIGESAFFACSNLATVTFGSCKPTFGNGAFSRCTKLSGIIVKDIVAWCSYNHGTNDTNPMYYAHHIYNEDGTELTDLTIPDNVTAIGPYAFYQCTGLRSVTFHNNVRSVGRSAFSDCI